MNCRTEQFVTGNQQLCETVPGSVISPCKRCPPTRPPRSRSRWRRVFYADARGNIAYWHIGRIPIRSAGDNPFLPHVGTGGDEWQGFLPFNQQPHALNPRQGWLVSWNNKPARGWANSSAGFWDWARCTGRPP